MTSGRRLIYLVAVNTAVVLAAFGAVLALHVWIHSGHPPIGDVLAYTLRLLLLLPLAGGPLPQLALVAVAVSFTILVVQLPRPVVLVAASLGALAVALWVIPSDASVRERLFVIGVGFVSGLALRLDAPPRAVSASLGTRTSGS